MGDDLGDRMKMYEGVEAGRRFMPLLPIVARLDGRCFSKFTKGLKRPYDERMSNLMKTTAMALAWEAEPSIVYTQSDEISLVWHQTDIKSQIYFDGKIQKMCSTLAAVASVYFTKHLSLYIPEKVDRYPTFDCRAWQVPSRMEAANTLLWREIDATKNSVSMACREHYSSKQMHGLGRADQMDMLMEKGINWNDYPTFFKRGTYIRRETRTGSFSPEEIERLPPKHNARTNPEATFERSEYVLCDFPPMPKTSNRVGVFFDGEDPVGYP